MIEWLVLAGVAGVLLGVFTTERDFGKGAFFVKERTMRVLAVSLLGTVVLLLFDFVIHRRVILASVILGFVLLLSGASLRIVSRRQLQDDFKYTVVKPKHLVTTGIYGVIRHPLYVAIFLMWLGSSFALGSAYGIIATFACVLPALLLRVHHEEALLRRAFGKKYDAYSRRTPRFVPRFV